MHHPLLVFGEGEEGRSLHSGANWGIGYVLTTWNRLPADKRAARTDLVEGDAAVALYGEDEEIVWPASQRRGSRRDQSAGHRLPIDEGTPLGSQGEVQLPSRVLRADEQGVTLHTCGDCSGGRHSAGQDLPADEVAARRDLVEDDLATRFNGKHEEIAGAARGGGSQRCL